MENLFEIAKSQTLIADVAKEIEQLWIELNRPEPPSGPITSVKGNVPSWLDERELEDMSEGDAVVHAARYNRALESLLELTGIWSAGGDQWNTKWGTGSPEWQQYIENSRGVALDFIANTLWDRFCDTM